MACLFGARLASVAPHAVALVGSWPDSLAAIRRRGVVLVDEAGTQSYPVQAYRLGQPVPPAEIVLLLMKAWQTPAVAPHLAGLLKPGGIVLSLQQSLGNLEALGQPASLGVTDLSARLLEPGYVRAGVDRPTLLNAPEWAVEVFRLAGFDIAPASAERVEGQLWGALAIRCALEALSAVLRLTYGELLERRDALLLMDRAATECAMIAWARRLTLPFADPLFAVRNAAQTLSDSEAPMLIDLRRRTPTEVDALNGAVAQAGLEAGVHATVNEVLWRQVRALAERPPL